MKDFLQAFHETGAGAALVFAGFCCAGFFVWQNCRLRRRIEEELQQLAEGRPFAGAPHDEIAHLLRKVEAQHAALRREASDAHFDLRAILAGMDDGVLVSDHRHLITLVNPALVQLFNLKGEPTGKTVLSTLRLPIVQTMLDGILQDGAAQQAEIELPSRGEPVQVVVSATPLRDAAGLPGALLVIRDVSRLRRLEEMRRELVANVSHELRTPLSIFHGYLENLLETANPPAEELQNGLTTMRKHSLRMNALVEDLLTLARLESGRDPLRLEAIDLTSFLEETLEDWQPKAAARQLGLTLQTDGGPPEVLADPLKLNQVLTNLLDNAVKHTTPGGSVVLGVRVVESSVELSVRDTGTGISRDDLPHIFQRFYRADKARSRELGGTGLGLAIVKHIAQAHGGNVRAESELGRGTTVTVCLPRHDAPGLPTPPAHVVS